MFLVVWWILLNCICCVLVLSRWSGSTPISFLFPRILFPPRSKKHRECFRDRNYVSDKLMNSTKCIFCSLVLSGWFKSTPFSQFDTYFFCPRIVCQPAPQNIKHCEKRLPLKKRSFRERNNFPRIWFRYLRFRILGLEINHLKAHNFVWQGCFFFHYYLQLWWPIELIFSQACYFMHYRFVILCWDTSSEKTGLWQ